MDHPAVSPLAPETSTVKTITPLLEHLGIAVGAVAATIGAAWGELQDGKLTSLTKGQGGQLIYNLYQLRQHLLASLPNFDDLARQCGIQTLVESDLPPETARLLVDETMRLLEKIVHHQLN